MKYPFRIPKAFLDNEGDLHMGRLVKALRRAEHQNDREEIARLLKLKRRIDRARIAAAESEVPGSSLGESSAPGHDNIVLRESKQSDIRFLREMLYQGVYWRAIASESNPSFEEGLSDPEVAKALANWGERDGDTAVIALADTISVGAAWYRFYTDENCIRGYIDEAIPAMVIAVQRDYRRRGIGQKMVEWLIDYAATQNVQKISLMVSKDNHALGLYRKCGFFEYAEHGESMLMLRKIKPS